MLVRARRRHAHGTHRGIRYELGVSNICCWLFSLSAEGPYGGGVLLCGQSA